MLGAVGGDEKRVGDLEIRECYVRKHVPVPIYANAKRSVTSVRAHVRLLLIRRTDLNQIWKDGSLGPGGFSVTVF